MVSQNGPDSHLSDLIPEPYQMPIASKNTTAYTLLLLNHGWCILAPAHVFHQEGFLNHMDVFLVAIYSFKHHPHKNEHLVLSKRL